MSMLAYAVHPGAILREEYLEPLNLKPYTLAKRLGIPRTRLERLAAETSPVTTDTALRLAKFFSTTPEFWMNMQSAYDLMQERQAKQAEIDAIKVFQREEAA